MSCIANHLSDLAMSLFYLGHAQVESEWSKASGCVYVRVYIYIYIYIYVCVYTFL